MIGQTISHYKILDKLGEGGMGVVYKAEDLKLKRTVAIKFLPKKLSIHGEERERFTLEAQSASALNHPNICTIHEIDEAESETFIVMEFIDGATLREWVRKKAEQAEGYRKLGVKEAIELAAQIAEGLEKAHEKGIIHRDVKPENVMVTVDGRVKIMDFGLAKLRGISKLTKIGSTVGTIVYMSPEQVEGIETDHRTDIFSFGVALYEMLAGQLPFKAEHEAALMYEIINVEPPPVVDQRKGVDSELNRIVMKCLEKNRDERYQSMREVAVDLKRYKRDSEGKKIDRATSGVVQATSPPAPWMNPRILVGAIGVLLFVIGGLAYLLTRGEGPKTPESILTRLTAGPGLEDEPSWSPDGKFLAYTTDDRGNFDIVVIPLGGGQPIRVVDSPADDVQPSWSPDGSTLAFVSARDHGGKLSAVLGLLGEFLPGKGGDVFLLPAFGGRQVKLVDDGYDPAWSPDGKNIVFRSHRGGRWDLWAVPAAGGSPKQLTRDEEFNFQPSWSPDSKWIVFGLAHRLGFGIGIISAYDESPARLLATLANEVLRPSWAPDGRSILFSTGERGSMNIWKISFPADANVSPTRVTLGEGEDLNLSISLATKRIAFSNVKAPSDIYELTLSTKEVRQITTETSNERNPHLSPDGKTLLVNSNRSGKYEIWTMDLSGRAIAPLISSNRPFSEGRWSPDGTQIAYLGEVSERDTLGIRIRKLNEISSRKIAIGQYFLSWSPDGKKISYDKYTGGKIEIWMHTLETREDRLITALDSEGPSLSSSWSPDGKFVSLNVERGGKRDVWIAPVDGGEPRKITSGEFDYSHAEWSPRNKDLIVCLRNHKNVCLVLVATGTVTEVTTFREPTVSLDFPTWSFDGKRVYFSLARKVGDVYTLENY